MRAAILLAGLALLATALVPVLAAVSRNDAETEVRVSPDDVAIGLLYSGRDLRVSATLPAEDEVAIRLEGQPAPLTLKRKGRKLGVLWMNVGELHYDDVPSVYLLRSTRPPEDLAPVDLRRELDVGYDALRDRVAAEPGEARDLFDQLVALREEDGLFEASSGDIETTLRDDGRKSVVSVIHLPPKAPVGEYDIEVIGFRDGRVDRTSHATLRLRRGTAVSFITRLAERQGLLYGCLAVVGAVLVGLGTGFLFSKGGGAH